MTVMLSFLLTVAVVAVVGVAFAVYYRSRARATDLALARWRTACSARMTLGTTETMPALDEAGWTDVAPWFSSPTTNDDAAETSGRKGLEPTRHDSAALQSKHNPSERTPS